MNSRHIEVSAELTERCYNPQLVSYSRRSFTILNTTDVFVAMDLIRKWYDDNAFVGNLVISNPRSINDAAVCPTYVHDTWRTQLPREIRYEIIKS